MFPLRRSMVFILALAMVKTGNAQKSFLGVDAKSLGYGGSGVIGIYDPSALTWNPAAIGVLRDNAVFFSIIRPFQINQFSAAAFIPSWGTWAGRIQQTTDGQSAALGWAYAWPAHLITGLSVQRDQYSHSQSSTIAFALLFTPKPVDEKKTPAHLRRLERMIQGMTVTAVIQNIPLDNSNPSPVVRLAASYTFPWLHAMVLYGSHFNEHQHVQQFGLSLRPLSPLELFAGLSDFDIEQAAAGCTWSWQNFQLHTSWHFQKKEWLLSAGFRLGAASRESSQKAHERAQALLQAGEKRLAFRYARRALEFDPDNEQARALLQGLAPGLAGSNVTIDSLLQAADGFVARRWYLSAAANYMLALKLDSDNKRAKDAIQSIKPQVDQHIEKWFQMGRKYQTDNEPAMAREVFEAILLVRPDHQSSRAARDEIDRDLFKKAEEFYYQGLGYYSQKNWKNAEEAFARALALKPDWSEAQTYLWHIREQMSQNSQHLAGLLDEAVRLEKKGDWLEARKKYRAALQMDPKNTLALDKVDELQTRLNQRVTQQFTRAESAFRKGDMETARLLFNEILEINPNHGASRRYLEAITSSLPAQLHPLLQRAGAYANRNEHVLCIDVLDSLLTLQPNMEEAQQLRRRSMTALNAATLVDMARKRYLRNQYHEALLLIQEALRKDPDRDQAVSLLLQTQKRIEAQVDELFNRGLNLYTEEKYRQAIAEWDKALAINPNHQGAMEYRRRAQERLDALNKLP